MKIASATRFVVTLACCLTAVTLFAQEAGTPAAAAPELPAVRLIIDHSDVRTWRVQGGRPEPDSVAVHLRGTKGWVQAPRPVSNFVLTFEARLTSPTARAGVFVRAWPTFDRETGAPNNGYRIVVAEGEGAGEVVQHRFEGRSEALTGKPAPTAGFREPGAWHRYSLECAGSILRVSIDDQLVAVVPGIGNPQGFVGFGAEEGVAEVRGVAIESGPRMREPPSRDAPSLSDPGVKSPMVLYEAKPRYTPAAMRARIQGSVLVWGVVGPDGTIEDLQVLQSLDPTLGLDEEALAAVRQFRFVPGTRDGRPVRVGVTIEVSFNLK